MPKKKTKKQEDSAGYFIPLNESDVKYSVEVKMKQKPSLKQLTKIEKKGKSKKKYVLVITEKPQAAVKIASALGNPKTYKQGGVSYYELERGGRKIVVACAVGHLFNLSSTEKGFPVFNIEWNPNYKIKKQDWSRKYHSLLTKLVKDAEDFVVATDYDVEGEVIGWNVVRFIAKKKNAKRMKFSSLTKKELEESFDNPEKNINWGHAIAGETRHFLDWMYGINLSRALMQAIKSTGRFKIMSIGRVQGPALNILVEKELEIQKFRPEPYWQVFIKLKGHKPELKYEKDLKDKADLNILKNLKGKKGEAKTERKKRELAPLPPFDLTSLQRESYRLFNFSPSRTLQLAQNLYLSGVISYPRTSSQKIPETVNPKGILKRLSTRFKETEKAVREKPVEGKKSDPAHPSIYPTGEFQTLNSDEEKLYNLIVKRFIGCFCENAEIEDKKINFITEKNRKKLNFNASGLEIKKKGWLEVYPLKMKETEIEDIEGEKEIEKSRTEEKETKPPKRYTPASLITELEKRNLGTKSTRSSIVETLYNRNYIKEQSIHATPLGINLVSSLKKYSPIIIDEKLTRRFEKDMENIQKENKNLDVLQGKILKQAKDSVKTISGDLEKHEKKIGKELVQAQEKNWEQEKEESKIAKCPECKKGELMIRYAKKFQRYFVGCSNYPKCTKTFSLPPGIIKKTEKKCDKCGFPILMRLMKGKKPWFFCFNPECESNKERVERNGK
jgi:DNA topoisomerase-1